MNRAERRRQQKKAKKAAKTGKAIIITGPSSEQQTLSIPQALDLAVQHYFAGRLSEADSICQKILQIDPNQHIALHLLGALAIQAGKNEVAIDLISKALAIKPDYVEAQNTLGNAFKGLGKSEEALSSYCQAVAINPEYTEAHYNLGLAYLDLGKREDAVNSFCKAIAINSKYAEAHNNLGVALRDLGRLDEAISSLRNAVTINPEYAEAHYNLGLAHQDLGQPENAFKSQRRAVALNSQNDMFWSGLAASLETYSFTSVDDSLWQDLLHLLERATVRPSNVIQPIMSALRHNPDFLQILELTGSLNPKIGIAYGDAAEKLSAIPLFLRIMELCPIFGLEIERMLTFLRRAMMEATVAGKTNQHSLPFSAALASQCFVNEYIFSETDEEKTAVENLQQQIATLVKKDQDVPASFVVALGAYRPLYGFHWAQELTKREWADSIKAVIDRQVSEPQEEQSLRPQISCLSPIENTVSQAVREQYEENPYPRWVRTSIKDAGKTIGDVLQEAPLRLDLADYQSPESPEILVAGCGTGQHALYTASRFLNARVLAVDLSLSSLSYAMRKTNELGCSNIEYAQADILELGSLGRQFDLVESVGVLHHLDDPLQGWRVLVDRLRPGGLMMIGLYSELARQDIVRGRLLISEEEYSTSPQDIRRCRQDIMAEAENGNPEMAKICTMRDFFSISECRDLLFHIQEHRYTLPRIEAALQSLKLTFLGFEMRDQRVLRKFEKSHPNEHSLTSLSLWHAFELENPDTFRGMYQFWCKKI
ncbi:MAG: tetratricopeptide repeat protein [Rhodospirillaceae bacterium]|nr:tetratricopeptide repeat protein [Rhodospirillaceae bacterium]